ncbi:enoyl-CoA hydratase-related protein [Halobacteriovorax sp. HLS]|uniref:enoyl-CoA hydratase-related protein n=1 Tax=Halobacteriovorax sp. HLS TaxID=2234000 RepID=UPI000FDA73FD|nr:enoyl-CoA hydratase-related protein [Halobacteriovorax sp. HLS]
MDELFLYELNEQGVATITLNRAQIHNAFNDQLISELTQKFIQMDGDESIRVVVLTGAGKSFCAGADLNWMKSMVNYSEQENFDDSKRLSDLFETINNFSRPVIGKINGAALGGGVGLVACCDYVIASEKAIFGLTEVMLGLVPAVISPYVIAKMGESNARATFLTAERFDAKKAKEYGLVHQVSLERHFHKDVDSLCDLFLKAAPKAQQVAKSLIKNVLELEKESYEKMSSYTCKTIAAKRISEEGQEGMNALLEKRKPNWIK